MQTPTLEFALPAKVPGRQTDGKSCAETISPNNFRWQLFRGNGVDLMTSTSGLAAMSWSFSLGWFFRCWRETKEDSERVRSSSDLEQGPRAFVSPGQKDWFPRLLSYRSHLLWPGFFWAWSTCFWAQTVPVARRRSRGGATITVEPFWSLSSDCRFDFQSWRRKVLQDLLRCKFLRWVRRKAAGPEGANIGEKCWISWELHLNHENMSALALVPTLTLFLLAGQTMVLICAYAPQTPLRFVYCCVGDILLLESWQSWPILVASRPRHLIYCRPFVPVSHSLSFWQLAPWLQGSHYVQSCNHALANYFIVQLDWFPTSFNLLTPFNLNFGKPLFI